MPRVLNLALAAFFLLVLSPIVTTFDDRSTVARIALVVLALPFLLLVVLCLASALRPGSLGRAARRARARRQG